MNESAAALDRIKAALAACPHPRGQCGRTVEINVADEGEEPLLVRATQQPCVEVLADDVVAVCDAIPEARRSPIVRGLRLGSARCTVGARIKLQPVDAVTGEDLTAEQLAPQPVHILVDHAWHLAEEADAKAATGASP